MFFIPGPFFAALTFPGVVVHELAHQFFCRLFRVAIFDVCYFRFGNPAGYVIHEHPTKASQQIWIGVGPAPRDYVLIWLGISIAMHAFPSTGDARSLRSAVSAAGVPLRVKIIAYPIVGIIFLGAIGSFFWLDAIYGVGVALAGPKLLVAVLA